MTIKEIMESAKNKFYERMNDPFIGSYALTFLLFNWRFFYYLTVAKTENRESLSANIIEAQNYLSVSSYVVPFCVSIFYTFGYPFIKEKIISFQLSKQKTLINIAKQIEEKILLTPEEMGAERDKSLQEQMTRMQLSESRKAHLDTFKFFVASEFNRLLNNSSMKISVVSDSSLFQEGYCYLLQGERLRRVEEITKSDDLVYAFGKITNEFTIVCKIGGRIPLPPNFQNGDVKEVFINKKGVPSQVFSDDTCVSITKSNEFSALISWI